MKLLLAIATSLLVAAAGSSQHHHINPNSVEAAKDGGVDGLKDDDGIVETFEEGNGGEEVMVDNGNLRGSKALTTAAKHGLDFIQNILIESNPATHTTLLHELVGEFDDKSTIIGKEGSAEKEEELLVLESDASPTDETISFLSATCTLKNGAASIKCTGTDACADWYGAPIKVDRAGVACNICNGQQSCMDTDQVVADEGSCNYPSACRLSRHMGVKEGSCNGYSACEDAYQLDVAGGSCNGSRACYEARDVNIEENSCTTTDACGRARSASIGTGSCRAEKACMYAHHWKDSNTGTIGSNSCNGKEACRGVGGNIGNNACNEPSIYAPNAIIPSWVGACEGATEDIPDFCPSIDAKTNGKCCDGGPGLESSAGEGCYCGDTRPCTTGLTCHTDGMCVVMPTEVVAQYDSSLKAPKCTSIGSSCTSGNLLNGTAGNVEPNAPNSLDSCTDGDANGSYGAYHSDESIDEVTVSAVGGGQLQARGLAEIEAKVWPYLDGSMDTADFYYTGNVTGPTWTYIGSLPAGGSGLRSLKIQYELSDSSMQAVRVNFRYFGSKSSCSGGVWDDVDDLVFTVAPSVEGAMEIREAKPAHKEPNQENCASIPNKRRCNDAFVCKWQNANGNGKGEGCYPKFG